MFPPPGPANKIVGIFELRVGDIADVHYHVDWVEDFNKTGKIINPNSWEADMVEHTREEALARGWSGTWFSSEYGIFNMEPDLLHAPYLSMIADVMPDVLSTENTLETFYKRHKREWGQMRWDNTCLGGAYFPWMCSGTSATPEGETWGWMRWGEDANWGVMTAALLPKPQFWALRVLFSPIWFPNRVSWKTGDEFIEFPLMNQYNSIDFSGCTFRTQMNIGSQWMSCVRKFRDVPLSCKPGETITARFPIWSPHVKTALDKGRFGYFRINVIDPFGFCPLKADILIIPESMQQKDDAGMPIGPDAIINQS